MKIGVACDFNPYEFKDYFSGGEVPDTHDTPSSTQALVKSFLDDGHTVYVFALNPTNERIELLSDRLKVFLIPYRLMPRTNVFQIYKIKQLRNTIRKELKNIDVLHAHWTYEYAYATKVFAKEIPVFCTVRDWCPFIMSLPMPLFGKIVWRFIKYRMFRSVMTDGNIHLIANSHYTRSCIKNEYPNIDVPIIPNSIKKDLILSERKVKAKNVTIVTIANGITSPRKNVYNLLKAFKMLHAQHDEAELLLLGKCETDNPVYLRWQQEGLLDGVKTLGKKSHEEMVEVLDTATIMVHPSLEETFGNTLIEAMARRIPVIGGEKSGAVPAVLGNGRYGLCCDVTNPTEIFNSINYLLDDENANKIIEAATIYLKSTFASEVVCRSHIELYSKYLS